MVGMFIGQYLLVNGHVNRDQLLAAVENQRKVNVSLEEIALEENYLSADQIDEIDAIRRNTGDSFQEIAVAKGYLTQEKVGRLIKLQKDRNIMLGESMVQLGIITMERFDELFDLFRKDLQLFTAGTAHNTVCIEKHPILKVLFNVSSRLFNNVINEPVKFVSNNLAEYTEPVDTKYVLSQRVKGHNGGLIILEMPDALMLKVASVMMRKPQSDLNEICLDANAEFLNILMGHFCIGMSLQGEKYNAEPPVKHLKSAGLPFDSPTEGIVISCTEGLMNLCFLRDNK